MQSIIDTLSAGSGKERLAVIADIVSIIGVSLATVVGGSLALTGDWVVANVIGFSIGALLSLAASSLVVLVFLLTSGWLYRRTLGHPIAQKILQFALWSTFVALFLMAVFVAYDIISSIQFVR